MKEKSSYRWTSGFFGLPLNYNIVLHNNIYELIHIAGFTHTDAYTLPVHLRKFYYNRLKYEMNNPHGHSSNPVEDTGNAPLANSPFNLDGTIKKLPNSKKVFTPLRKDTFKLKA